MQQAQTLPRIADLINQLGETAPPTDDFLLEVCRKIACALLASDANAGTDPVTRAAELILTHQLMATVLHVQQKEVKCPK